MTRNDRQKELHAATIALTCAPSGIRGRLPLSHIPRRRRPGDLPSARPSFNRLATVIRQIRRRASAFGFARSGGARHDAPSRHSHVRRVRIDRATTMPSDVATKEKRNAPASYEQRGKRIIIRSERGDLFARVFSARDLRRSERGFFLNHFGPTRWTRITQISERAVREAPGVSKHAFKNTAWSVTNRAPVKSYRVHLPFICC